MTYRRIAVLGALCAALAAPAPAAAQTVTLTLAPSTVVHGGQATASGAVDPVVAGASIAVERSVGGSWETLATATTDSAGSFSAAFSASAGGAVRARVEATGVVSGEVLLAVIPRLALHRSAGRAFLGAPIRVNVQPATYAATVTVTTIRGGRVVGRTRARVRNGLLRLRAPTPGVGRFSVRLRFPASGSLSQRTITTRVRSRARRLSVGSRGADVRALHRRLAELRIHVPGIRSSFTWATHDSVIAFQKTRGLARTGVVGTATWQALGRARIPRPRFARPSLHLEIDKTRQIVMLVRRGEVAAVLPTSTGATGNTPVGRWRIYYKSPGYLPSGMYYSLFFLRGFAVHGYASVPAYPASHGCARIPIWAAVWLYHQSHVGERVYVYH